jgi:hypothetical protein
MPTTIIWWGSSYLGQQIGNGGVLGMPRTDGLADGTDIIQGVRTYDSIAGNWTTPDAFEGYAHDPASQKSYMWVGNNPEGYSDPSGYVPIVGENVYLAPFPIVVPLPSSIYIYVTREKDHAFVEVIGEGRDTTFEAGPDASWDLKPQPSYGSHVSGHERGILSSAHPPVTLSKPAAFKTMSQWDEHVRDVFEGLNRQLYESNIGYGLINSNTYVAEGLHRLGYSDDAITKIMGPDALGSGTTARSFLESDIIAGEGGGFNLSVSDSDSGAGGDGACGVACEENMGGPR